MKDREENHSLSEHIRQLEKENNILTGKLKAANREIERMHHQVLLAKAAAKEAAGDMDAVAHSLYVGATLRYGAPTQDGSVEAYFPFIDKSLWDKYDMTMVRDDTQRMLTVRVKRKEETSET